jgi:hypothetical protein
VFTGAVTSVAALPSAVIVAAVVMSVGVVVPVGGFLPDRAAVLRSSRRLFRSIRSCASNAAKFGSVAVPVVFAVCVGSPLAGVRPSFFSII